MTNKLRNVPEGTFFVLESDEQRIPTNATVYMRASGIPNFPTSVAQIIHCPDRPESCGTGAFPALVALHTNINTVQIEQLQGVVPEHVFKELQRVVGARN